MASFLPGQGPVDGDTISERDEVERYDDEGNYRPTVLDIAEVQAVFAALQLPPEMVDRILDLAEYWACSTQTVTFTGRTDGSGRMLGNAASKDKLLIRTSPIGLSRTPTRASPAVWHELLLPPRPLESPFSPKDLGEMLSVDGVPRTLVNPCRKIVFTIDSRDQGWISGDAGDQETYRGSWTWFEAGIERPEKDNTCPPGCPERRNYDASPSPRTRHPDVELPLCSLRSVDPPLRPVASQGGAPLPTGPVFDTEDTLEPNQQRTVQENQQYAYAHDLLPNESRKIVCNRTATPRFETKRVVWRWTDDVVEEDLAATPGSPPGPEGHATQQNEQQQGGVGAAVGSGSDVEQQQPLGSTANEAVEKLGREGRGRRTGDGAFVRSLQLGDVVTVWGKARFPHWTNIVNRVTVDVYFAI